MSLQGISLEVAIVTLFRIEFHQQNFYRNLGAPDFLATSLQSCCTIGFSLSPMFCQSGSLSVLPMRLSQHQRPWLLQHQLTTWLRKTYRKEMHMTLTTSLAILHREPLVRHVNTPDSYSNSDLWCQDYASYCSGNTYGEVYVSGYYYGGCQGSDSYMTKYTTCYGNSAYGISYYLSGTYTGTTYNAYTSWSVFNSNWDIDSKL
jgi:hypothetical protein